MRRRRDGYVQPSGANADARVGLLLFLRRTTHTLDTKWPLRAKDPFPPGGQTRGGERLESRPPPAGQSPARLILGRLRLLGPRRGPLRRRHC